jgi:hypothetical protein
MVAAIRSDAVGDVRGLSNQAVHAKMLVKIKQGLQVIRIENRSKKRPNRAQAGKFPHHEIIVRFLHGEWQQVAAQTITFTVEARVTLSQRGFHHDREPIMNRSP